MFLCYRDYIYGDDTETAKIGEAEYTPVSVSGYAPIRTKDGLTDVSYCNVCGSILKKQEIIPTLRYIDADGDGICDLNGADMTTAINIGKYCTKRIPVHLR